MNDSCELCGKPGADMAFHFSFIFGLILGRIHAGCLDMPADQIASRLLYSRLRGRSLGDVLPSEIEEVLAPAEVRAWKEQL